MNEIETKKWTNPIEKAEGLRAPRLSAGWGAILGVMKDGKSHGYVELEAAAALAADLRPRTVENLLRCARRMRPARLRTVKGRGRERVFRLP